MATRPWPAAEGAPGPDPPLGSRGRPSWADLLRPWPYWTLPTLAIVLLVLVRWTGVTGERMSLGGDDSHLYYLEPLSWLRHAPSTVLDGNLAGYNPRVYCYPLLLLLAAVDATGLNVQGVAIGVTMALTYAGVVRLTLEVLGPRTARTQVAAAVAGAVVVCAPMLAETQWTHLLYSIYWMPLLPWLMLFTLWHQGTGHWRWVFAAAGACVVAAPAINSVPWTFACALLLVALAVVFWITGVSRPRPGRLATLVAAVAAVNAFWILPILASATEVRPQIQGAVSASGKQEAIQILRALVPLQRTSDTLSLRISGLQMEVFDSPTLGPDRWSQRLALLGILPLAVVVGCLFSPLRRGRHVPRQDVVLGLVVVLFVFLFLTTPNLLPFGLALAELFTRHVPGWTAVRNFYDKFAIPFVVVFALTTGVCFHGLLSRLRPLAYALTGLVMVAALVIYDLPALDGAAFRLPYYAGLPWHRGMDGLPADYVATLRTLRRLPPGPVLSVPLMAPAYTVVFGTPRQAAYIGVSPIFFLTGRSDYNGIDAFASGVVPYLTTVVRRSLEQGDAEGVARVVGALGVRYVVVYDVEATRAVRGRIAAVPDPAREAATQSALLRAVAGGVVARHGPYQIREVRPALRHDLFELAPPGGAAAPDTYLRSVAMAATTGRAGETCTGSRPLTFDQRSPTRYLVRVPATPRPCALVFRQVYSPEWTAREVRPPGGRRVRHTKALGFANGFVLPPSPSMRTLEVDYGLQRVIPVGALISVAATTILAAVAAAGRARAPGRSRAAADRRHRRPLVPAPPAGARAP